MKIMADFRDVTLIYDDPVENSEGLIMMIANPARKVCLGRGLAGAAGQAVAVYRGGALRLQHEFWYLGALQTTDEIEQSG